MKKQYFFARLFVRTAKGLALLVILFGIGFCVLRCYQASSAADAKLSANSSPVIAQNGALQDHVATGSTCSRRIAGALLAGVRHGANLA